MQAVACAILDALDVSMQMRDLEVAPEFFYHWYKKRKLLPENPAGFEPRVSILRGIAS